MFYSGKNQDDSGDKCSESHWFSQPAQSFCHEISQQRRSPEFINRRLRDAVNKKTGYFMTLCKIDLIPTYPT